MLMLIIILPYLIIQVHAAMTMIALITLHVEKMKSVKTQPVLIVQQMLIVK